MRTRIFFITDIHGSTTCFKKFLNAAEYYKADTLILGGDITGKVLVPIEEREKLFVAYSEDGVQEIKKESIKEYMKKLESQGRYYFVSSGSEIEELRVNRGKLEELFDKCILERLESWLYVAEQKLGGKDVECYISPGNDDKKIVDEVLKKSSVIVNPEERVVKVRETYEMLTLGYSNKTPWNSPRELDESELYEKISSLCNLVQDMKSAIFNFHVPPVETELDKAPQVSEQLEYVRDLVGLRIIHAGSRAVREAIERHQPMLGLHGHIHESRGSVRIGRTVCINPGSEYETGMLRGAIIDLDKELKDFLLTVG